jgi:phospholipid/cholesterol/gamma-HCH transport system substrate-binding protein
MPVGAEQQPDDSGRRARTLGALALALGAFAVALILLDGDDYKVRARFLNASQLVAGNLVQISGRKVGVVDEIRLDDDGAAEVTLSIDEDHAPLRRGTTANARLASLSGSANRYVDLQMPPGKPPTIPDGGLIPETQTTSQVDVDEFFNTFDRRTRDGLRRVIRGQAAQYGGRGLQANLGWRYLNPSLVAADRLFREINIDERLLSRFLVEQSSLVSDLAERRDDLVALVDNLARFTGAIAREDESLAATVAQLPPFMKRANSTFVNLRATLDDLDPFVEEAKPVAPRLRDYLAQLRPFAQDARPTVRNLSNLIRGPPGAKSDLIDLAHSVLPLRDIAIGPVRRNGEERPGGFPTTTRSLQEQTPHWAFQRPYAVDLTGWFDDFSHSGIYDANGSASRVALNVNAFAAVNGVLEPVPPELRNEVFNHVATRGQNNRCPGSMERDPGDGSAMPLMPSPDYNCDPRQKPPGK